MLAVISGTRAHLTLYADLQIWLSCLIWPCRARLWGDSLDRDFICEITILALFCDLICVEVFWIENRECLHACMYYSWLIWSCTNCVIDHFQGRAVARDIFFHGSCWFLFGPIMEPGKRAHSSVACWWCRVATSFSLFSSRSKPSTQRSICTNSLAICAASAPSAAIAAAHVRRVKRRRRAKPRTHAQAVVIRVFSCLFVRTSFISDGVFLSWGNSTDRVLLKPTRDSNHNFAANSSRAELCC